MHGYTYLVRIHAYTVQFNLYRFFVQQCAREGKIPGCLLHAHQIGNKQFYCLLVCISIDLSLLLTPCISSWTHPVSRAKMIPKLTTKLFFFENMVLWYKIEQPLL